MQKNGLCGFGALSFPVCICSIGWFRVASNILVRVICKLFLPSRSIAESLLGSMNTY